MRASRSSLYKAEALINLLLEDSLYEMATVRMAVREKLIDLSWPTYEHIFKILKEGKRKQSSRRFCEKEIVGFFVRISVRIDKRMFSKEEVLRYLSSSLDAASEYFEASESEKSKACKVVKNIAYSLADKSFSPKNLAAFLDSNL